MKQGTVEKSARLSKAKVILGHDTAPLNGAPEALCAKGAESKAHRIIARTPLLASDRIAELEGQLKLSAEHITELQQQFAELRSSDTAARAALAEMQNNLDELRTAAEQRGYSEGCAAAERTVQTKWQQQVASWEEGVATLATQLLEYRESLQASIADIVLAATTKIIGEQLTDAHRVGKAIEHIIHESDLAGPMKVLLAPAHYEELTRSGAMVLQRLSTRHLELQPDARVSYGGCLLETPGAVVDGRYDVQLKKLLTIVREFHPAADSAP